MFENSIYSVISPEGCATILWRDPKKMLDAAKAMKLSAKDLLELNIIDEIISEPTGGAHRDKNKILDNVKNTLTKNLQAFENVSREEILNQRKNKFLKIGRDKGFINNPEEISDLSQPSNKFNLYLKLYKKNKIKVFTGLAFLIIVLYFIL